MFVCKKAQISKHFTMVRTVGTSLSDWLILGVEKQEHFAFLRLVQACGNL